MSRNPRILVAEDQENAIEILKLAFLRAQIRTELDFVHDGEGAIEYLTKCLDGPYGSMPALLLLDLKMPRVDGFDVLEWAAAPTGPATASGDCFHLIRRIGGHQSRVRSGRQLVYHKAG